MPRRPFWDWKARGCAEVSDYYSVPFAVKEYIQNQISQVLKEKLEREWDDWEREDLRRSTATERKSRKVHLIQRFPGLLTGPHGAIVKRSKEWEAIYVLSGTIDRTHLKLVRYASDLQICTVMWKNSSTGLTGLTFFNNHLDPNSGFSSFVVDGASTSRRDLWAIGEKGKGFNLATQYMFEEVERISRKKDPALDTSNSSNASTKPKVSFRVGNRIGELAWRKARYEDEEDLLRIMMDDLSPLTREELMQHRTPNEDESTDEDEDHHPSPMSTEKRKKAMKRLIGIYKRRFTQQLAIKNKNVIDACQPSDEVPLAGTDEVSINILELSRDLEPEYVFSGIYGIIPPPQSWRIPGTEITFFQPQDQPTFFNRNQLILSGPPLNRLGINYHGDLRITADRVSIVMGSNQRYQKYLQSLSSAVDTAFRTIPELAVQLALDILTDDNGGVGTIIRQLQPADDTFGEVYRTAFIAAWRILDPELPQDKTLYPCKPENAANDLVKELGMVPVTVKSEIIRRLLDRAGAFKDIRRHAEGVLNKCHHCADIVPGMARLRRAIAHLLPSVDPTSIVLRDYRLSYPKVLWDQDSKTISVAVPGDCWVHPGDKCLCWVGPCLTSAISSWSENEEGVEEPSQAAIFRAFMWAMDGVTDMKEPTVKPVAQPDVDDMDSVDDEFGFINDSRNSDDEDEQLLPSSPRVSQPAHDIPEVLQASQEPSAPIETVGNGKSTPASKPFTTPSVAAPHTEAPESPLMMYFRGLQTAFDQQASRADAAETQLESLRTQLFEAQTAHAMKESLIKEREKEIDTRQGELAGQRSLFEGLEAAIHPIRAMLDKFSKAGENGAKRQRDERDKGEGSSKRARQCT